MIVGTLFTLLAIAFLIVVPIGLRSALRRALRRRVSEREQRSQEITAGLRCPCGYDLLATDAARCPECGRVIHFSKTPDELGLTPDEFQRLSLAKQRRNAAAGRSVAPP